MNVLNHLHLIQEAAQRRQALYDAQMLHLKSYRGVPYVEAAHEQASHPTLTYRGHAYQK